MLYTTSGDGELQKNQGEYKTMTLYGEGEGGDGDGDGESGSGEGSGSSENKIELSKKELSEKITDGRSEGIEKGKRDALQSINETLGTDFESVEDAQENLKEAHIGDIKESDVVQDLQSTISEKDEIIQKKDQKIQDLRVKDKMESDLKQELGDKELKLPVEDLKTLHDQDYGYVEKDGELYVTENGERKLNDSGQYMKYTESVLEYAQSRNLIEGSASGGSGGSTTPSGSGGGSENPWKTGNLTEQARITANNPQKAERMKKRANN